MQILELLKTRDPRLLRDLLLVTCLAALASAALLAIINFASEQAAIAQPVSPRLILLYAIAFVTYSVANRGSLRMANEFLQERLGALRVRIADKIRRSDLRTLEQVGSGDIYATLAQDINHLPQNFPLIVTAAQSVFLLIFCLLYIASVSLISFAVVAGAIGLGMALFFRRRAALKRVMATVHAREAEMLESLTHFTEGFQEVRLNADRNDALFRRFGAITDDLESVIVGVGSRWVVVVMFSNAFLYALLGTVILVLPRFFHGYTDVVYKVVAASIFCVAPLNAVIFVAPLYDAASVGLAHVFALEKRLEEGAVGEDAGSDAPSPKDFRKIEFVDAKFSYRDAEGNVTFTTGPWSITIERGETLFLIGGNGSGKSTLMKLLSGLYVLDSGTILVDGLQVDGNSLLRYRELFSGVFSDFHLFRQLYGLEGLEEETVQAAIARMELSGKVEYKAGSFSTVDLSTGQRKRLALIASLLEDREIYLFDEWAADQDSHFRAIFYNEILPDLKRRGKTILAVTHDAQYWHVSDRQITMDLGTLATRAGG
jgi:putative ATP-binding cassette transporter